MPDTPRADTHGDAGGAGPVKAKVVIIDASSMAVVWLNEAAVEGAGIRDHDSPHCAADVIPVAEAMGVPAALERVAKTGVAEHLSMDVVSMGRGSITLVTSVYRLPDGLVMTVTENAWQSAEPASRGGGAGQRGTRRGR